MRKAFVMMAILLAVASFAVAAGHRARHHRRAHALDQLQLTEQQTAKIAEMKEQRRAAVRPIREAIESAAKEYRALKQANDPRAADVRAQIRDLREELEIMKVSFRGEFETILTSEQKAKLETMKSNRRERRRQSSEQRERRP